MSTLKARVYRDPESAAPLWAVATGGPVVTFDSWAAAVQHARRAVAQLRRMGAR